MYQPLVFKEDKEQTNNGDKKAAAKKWPKLRYSCHATDNDLEQIADDIVRWAHETEEIKASAVMIELEVYRETFYDWMERSPRLKKAYGQVKEIIGNKREKIIWEGKGNQKVYEMNLPLYCPDYAAWKKEERALAKELSSSAPVHVVMHTMPGTESVPVKYEGTE